MFQNAKPLPSLAEATRAVWAIFLIDNKQVLLLMQPDKKSVRTNFTLGFDENQANREAALSDPPLIFHCPRSMWGRSSVSLQFWQFFCVQAV